METTYEPSELNPNEGITILGPVAVSYLLKATKWAKFLSIIGFIVAAILTIVALFIGSLFTMISKLSPAASLIPSAVGTTVTVMYLCIAAVIFILHLFLYQFASRTQQALLYHDSGLMDGGIHRLQSYFKMLGIIMIIYLTLMILGILGMMSLAAMMPHVASPTSL